MIRGMTSAMECAGHARGLWYVCFRYLCANKSSNQRNDDYEIYR